MSAGSLSALRKRKASTPLTKLTPAERAAKVLAFRGPTHNFTVDRPVPSNGVPVGRGCMRTSDL